MMERRDCFRGDGRQESRGKGTSRGDRRKDWNSIGVCGLQSVEQGQRKQGVGDSGRWEEGSECGRKVRMGDLTVVLGKKSQSHELRARRR